MAESRRDDLAALSALGEPNRRRLYDHVAGQRSWVSREQAADAVGIQRGIAAHHLDRLADEGLLETDYQRLTGRRGPGAGRPAKVYRRAATEIDVALPARQYELAGRLLATAADRSRGDGTPIVRALGDAARDEGRRLGGRVGQRAGQAKSARVWRAHLLEELEALGFEPVQVGDGVTVLRNCPFHRLAQEHTELICRMNLAVLESMLGAIGGTGLRAVLEPEEGCCCVRLHPAPVERA
jgi:predicted ArsR family transcriptional regulator